jgi:hypothetical protein
MSAARVRPRLLADRQTVVDVPPVLWRDVRRIDPERFDRVDCLQHLLDFRPTGEAQQALSPGRTKGTVEQRSPGPTARRMSIREATVT